MLAGFLSLLIDEGAENQDGDGYPIYEALEKCMPHDWSLFFSAAFSR
jgi:hypothetical protein